MRYHLFLLKMSVILILLTLFSIGVSAASDSNQNVTSYYVSIEPDLEGNASFQINVQNFNYDNPRVLGIGFFDKSAEDLPIVDGKIYRDVTFNPPNPIIDIFYGDGKIETISTYVGELELLNKPHGNIPDFLPLYYINATDEMKNKKISNFDINFYDSNINSENEYPKYPFDSHSFTYDISFLNNAIVMLTVLPANPNNFYGVDVSLNHIYKNQYESNFEEPINPVYDGVYKIKFNTDEGELVDKINIIYHRERGLAQISFYILFILSILLILFIPFTFFRTIPKELKVVVVGIFLISYISTPPNISFYILLIFPILLVLFTPLNFFRELPKELNAIIFGTFLTIYTFGLSIGYSYKPSWVELSIFDIFVFFDLFLIARYFKVIIEKWNK